jgi:hypothetical protein
MALAAGVAELDRYGVGRGPSTFETLVGVPMPHPARRAGNEIADLESKLGVVRSGGFHFQQRARGRY